MKLKLFKPLWGHQGSLTEAVEQASEAGFDGLEGPVPEASEACERLQDELTGAGLEMIAEVYTGGWYVPKPSATPSAHLDDLRAGIERSLPLSPLFVNTQTGLDAWPLATQIDYFEQVLELEEHYGTNITIETHRSRSTFNPWVTAELAKALPQLKLNLDFSHWCCVAERLVMEDDPKLLDLFAKQCWHLHARVGYDEGPQVPDPRAPEYAEAVEAHVRWWRRVWEAQEARGFDSITMTPEFGTDGYLHLEPYTQRPMADLWEVNQWMAGRLRREFAQWSA